MNQLLCLQLSIQEIEGFASFTPQYADPRSIGKSYSPDIILPPEMAANDARLPSSVPLLYEECVLLSTPETTGGFLLKSEPRRYSATGRQEVTWSQECTGSCLWKILPKPLRCSSHVVAKLRPEVKSHLSNVATEAALQFFFTSQGYKKILYLKLYFCADTWDGKAKFIEFAKILLDVREKQVEDVRVSEVFLMASAEEILRILAASTGRWSRGNRIGWLQ
ncbi:hypothetical protein TNCV_609221 [Trichonephila clavipes]|nr:hypothetical protein TNCV_609221 [Trichonephila clavipes]